jgi:hypothetical protein
VQSRTDFYVQAALNIYFFTRCEPPLEERVVMKTQRQRAKAVFDIIDLDCSGYLEPFELAELLLQWGCPDDDITVYMANIDSNGDGQKL